LNKIRIEEKNKLKKVKENKRVEEIKKIEEGTIDESQDKQAYNLLANPNFDDLLNPLAKKDDYEKTAKEYNNKYANKLKNWTTYNFTPIIIIITNENKAIYTRISIQLNETIFSAKEKFYKLIGDNIFSRWLYDGELLPNSRIFENYDIENFDKIIALKTSCG
jgi:hypothetical protein